MQNYLCSKFITENLNLSLHDMISFPCSLHGKDLLKIEKEVG